MGRTDYFTVVAGWLPGEPVMKYMLEYIPDATGEDLYALYADGIGNSWNCSIEVW